MKARDRALLKAYHNELGFSEVTKSDAESLIAQIQEATVLTEREVGTVILVYSYDDYLYRSEFEKQIVSALRNTGVQVITKLVKANTYVRKYMPWPFPSIPKPGYWDEVIKIERRKNNG